MLLAIEIALVLLLGLLYCLQKPWRHSLYGDRFPGPSPMPVVGNSLDIGTTTADLYVYVLKMYRKFYGSAFRLWAFNNLNIFLTTPEDMEVLLTDHNQLAKSSVYDYFHSWMGDSIATSTGAKWKQTRKFLANTFTKRKLEEYVETFYTNGRILVEIMQSRAGGPAFNIQSVVSLNALDNLSETLMGLDINAQRDANSKYIQAIHNQSNIVVERSFKPWLHSELIFKLTGLQNKEKQSLQVLHGTTTKAVETRLERIMKETPNKGEIEQAAENSPFTQNTELIEENSTSTNNRTDKKAVYVDELIRSQKLTQTRIRGEVDVMGFAGHDTISVCVSFTLWNLAWHPDIQDKVIEELDAFWSDPEEKLTYNKLHEFRYLEMVVKESLRLYPSIPVIGRRVNADLPLKDGLVAPQGSDVLVGIYLVHRDPEIYPDPDKFDPDRFLPENARGRSAYAYIPFSMGPRFCAGWKFAMLQVKCTVAQVLRAYRFLPGTEKPQVKVSLEPIAAMKEGVPVRIELRNPNGL